MDNGRYPTGQQGLEALCRKPTTAPIPPAYEEGGYLKKPGIPRDEWGNAFVYMVPGPDGTPYEILSYGSDGEPGGEGEAADISSLDVDE